MYSMHPAPVLCSDCHTEGACTQTPAQCFLPPPCVVVRSPQPGGQEAGGATRMQRLEAWWCVQVVNIGEFYVFYFYFFYCLNFGDLPTSAS
jgi:hypothetical protein